MDTLLEQLDHAAGPGGLPVLITGLRALLQRLLIRLSVRRGSFAPDPALGSELYKLTGRGEARDRLAFHCATEALAPEPVKVTSAACRDAGPDCLAVTIGVAVEGREYPLEVSV